MSNLEMVYELSMEDKFRDFIVFDESKKGTVEPNREIEVNSVFCPKNEGK